MLEQEYYGSDHEERETMGTGKAKKETVQEELARLVSLTHLLQPFVGTFKKEKPCDEFCD